MRPVLLQFMDRVMKASPNAIALMAAMIRLHEKHPGVANRWLAELDATLPDSDSSRIDADIERWVGELARKR